MTRPVLILVAGSRALAGHVEARAWLRAELDARAPAVVVTGDAGGPDAWAVEWASEAGGAWSKYTLDGAVWGSILPTTSLSWARFIRPPPVGSAAYRRWPLARNAAMVRDVASLAERYDVTVLALRAEWATTHGTEHTTGLARRAGLMVVERVFARAVGT